jgi:UDP-N-acetylmuramate--alanine ligase
VRLSSAVHFVGISGIGMSALARILLQRGYRVTGSSDRRTALTERLIAEGARVFFGHDAANVGDADTVVVSSAIDSANPEVAVARRRRLDIIHRGALLARLMDERRGIAVAGTHGKTTTTAMLASVLEGGGLEPSVVVGGLRADTGTNATDGAGEWFLSEADESDRSFLDLHPEIAVVTNIENDHIASDDELPQLLEAFERFANALPASGLALFGADDPLAARLASQPRAARTRTFGFDPRADVAARDERYEGFGSRFTVVAGGAALGEVVLNVPGAINILDALPAIAVGLELAVPFEAIAGALARFGGVGRRFQILARTPRLTVVDDYAHHPTAVAATIAAARAAFDGPLVVAFQPHRYSRARYLADEFARALRGADSVVLTDVYAASEVPLANIDARTIGTPLAARGASVTYVNDVDALPAYLLANAPPGALVLMLGAGSISSAAAALAQRLNSLEAVAQ